MTDKKYRNNSKPTAPSQPPSQAAQGQTDSSKPEIKDEANKAAAERTKATPATAGGQAPQKPAQTGQPTPPNKPEPGGTPPLRTPPPNTPAPPSKGGGGMAAIALLIALIAAAGSGYLWYQWDQEASARSTEAAGMDARLDEAVSKATKASKDALTAVTDQVEAQKSALKTLEEQLSGQLKDQEQQLLGKLESQQQLLRSELKEIQQKLQDQDEQFKTQLEQGTQQRESAVTQLQDQLKTIQLGQRGVLSELEAAKTAIAKGDINALALAEVEYLLRMGDYKLRFQRNVPSAIEALDQADKRLKQVDELPFATVERMIGENLATLRAVQLPDFSKISQQIGELAKKVDDLPLKVDAQVANLKGRVVPDAINLEQSESEAEPQAPWWERAIESAWAQMKDVVIVRHGRSSGPPLIAVEEEYFLRENLRLELEAMRLALLRNDPATFQAANKLVQEWTKTYFDTKAETVSSFVDELQELHKIQLNPYVPDISGTLQTFDDVMERRQPLRASTPAPASQDAPIHAEADNASKSDSSAAPASAPGEATQ